jgi:MFS family permease
VARASRPCELRRELKNIRDIEGITDAPRSSHGRDAHATYYGWSALAIAALAMVCTLPGRTQGLGLITLPLLRDLNLTELQWANVNLAATLVGALFCIGVGRMIDRFGARLVLTVVVACLGLSVIAMSRAGGIPSLLLTATLTRGFGQSALSVVSLAIVGKWFVRKLSLAMGIYSVLLTIGFMIAFPTVQLAVEHHGWRAVWFAMGWVLVLIVTPVAMLVLRSTPESIGQVVDGGSGGAPSEVQADPAPAGATLAEALATPAFWAFGLASSAFGLISSGILLFNEGLLRELGFGSNVFRELQVVLVFSGLLANFIGGWMGQKFSLGRLMCLGMLLMGAAMAALPIAHTKAGVRAYAVCMGVSAGIVTVVFFTCWGRIFGRQHLGKIQGAAQLLTVVASAVGPLLVAWSLHVTGSYMPLLHWAAPVSIALGAACWLVPIPRTT